MWVSGSRSNGFRRSRGRREIGVGNTVEVMKGVQSVGKQKADGASSLPAFAQIFLLYVLCRFSPLCKTPKFL